MKKKKHFHKCADRIPCRFCEETGNRNWRNDLLPFKPCNHCNGTGWVVKKPRAIRKDKTPS